MVDGLWVGFSKDEKNILLGIFRKLFNLYPPTGAAKAVPKVVQFFLLMFEFWIRKRILEFQFTGGFVPFWDLENVLSPEGTLQSRYRRRSYCFLLMFYFDGGRGPTF